MQKDLLDHQPVARRALILRQHQEARHELVAPDTGDTIAFRIKNFMARRRSRRTIGHEIILRWVQSRLRLWNTLGARRRQRYTTRNTSKILPTLICPKKSEAHQ
jgi:hypothetical protein